MKDSSILLQPQITFNPVTQCHSKKSYKFKRRAIESSRELAASFPDEIFTVYHCPHCGRYHVGKVRKE